MLNTNWELQLSWHIFITIIWQLGQKLEHLPSTESFDSNARPLPRSVTAVHKEHVAGLEVLHHGAQREKISVSSLATFYYIGLLRSNQLIPRQRRTTTTTQQHIKHNEIHISGQLND